MSSDHDTARPDLRQSPSGFIAPAAADDSNTSSQGLVAGMTDGRELWASRHRRGGRAVQAQPFGTLRLLPIALSYEARLESCQLLNHILADSLILAGLYLRKG